MSVTDSTVYAAILAWYAAPSFKMRAALNAVFADLNEKLEDAIQTTKLLTVDRRKQMNHANKLVAAAEYRAEKAEADLADTVATVKLLQMQHRQQIEHDGALIAERDRRIAEQTTALKFYADNWNCKTSKVYGGLEYSPNETLLDDCGNVARDRLGGSR